MSLTERLRERLSSLINPAGPHKNRKQLADALGVDPSQLNRFLAGKRGLNMETLGRILEALDARVSFPDEAGDTCKKVELVTPDRDAADFRPQEKYGRYRAIPQVSCDVAAREGFLPADCIETWVLVYADDPSIRYRTNLVAIHMGKGHVEMLPIIMPGDLVLVDREDNKPREDGGIYLVRDPEEGASIRRVRQHKDRDGSAAISFYSDNMREYPPQTFSVERDFSGDIAKALAGRVVSMWSDMTRR